MSRLRFKVVEEAFKKRPIPAATPNERPSRYYAKYVFNHEKMRKYLPLEAYQRYCSTLDSGTPLDLPTADLIAQGMKQWAIEMGATHCTHWFQPLTEGTAEKHDAFVEHDGKGGMIEELFGQTPRTARARCVLLPQRWHPLHFRGARLLCLGSGKPRLPHRRHPDDSHRFHLLHR